MKKFIIGVDVSKLKLDVHCHGQRQYLVVSNDLNGYKSLLRWLKKEVSKDLTSMLIVMEYTGIYTYRLENFLQATCIDYTKRSALDIKRSAGMKRGKTDKADAGMISEYGWNKRESLKPMQPINQHQQQLQQLMAYRDKVVADRASYESRIKELKGQIGIDLNDKIRESTEYIMQVFTSEINQLKITIGQLIASDEALQTNYDLITSVCGIGFATAIHVLIVTGNFTRFDDARKFACYSGVAPFEYSSGKSIHGKTRTSHLANKKIKSLLTMAAISAIQHDGELKEKYQQKTEEGKPKMSALNIIRFKLIERIFAVIKRQTPYILSKAA